MSPDSSVSTLRILPGNCLETISALPDKSVQCVVTSPPYFGLRSYLPKDHPLKHLEIGTEKTPAEYVEKLVNLFRVIKSKLRDDGTVWLNLGDSYAGSGRGEGKKVEFSEKQKTNPGAQFLHAAACESGVIGREWVKPPEGFKQKDLIGIPWRVAFALQADGWYLRSDIIWAKPNCMPESVTDRPTRSHEYIFLLSKSAKYFYDHEAIKEPCIYDVDGTGTAARKARASEELKSHPNGKRAGIRPGGYKNSVNFDGKNKGNDKQRGHSRSHQGFNERWDNMEKAEQCNGMRNKRDVWRHDADAIVLRWLQENSPELFKEFLNQSRNRKDIFQISPAQYPEAHFATFPPELIKPCILAGSRAGDVVLDPFGGSGTTGEVALELGRRAVLCELNPDYIPLIEQRTFITPGFPI